MLENNLVPENNGEEDDETCNDDDDANKDGFDPVTFRQELLREMRKEMKKKMKQTKTPNTDKFTKYLKGQTSRHEDTEGLSEHGSSDDESQRNAYENHVFPRNARHAVGTFDIPKAASEVLYEPRFDNRLADTSEKYILRHNPKPKGGALHAPDIDAAFLTMFSRFDRNKDDKLRLIQRDIYNITRPALTLLRAFEREDIIGDISAPLHNLVIVKIQEVLSLAFHTAEKIRIDQRKQLAKAANWSAACIEACDTITSSAEFDAELFGPEFAEFFHHEAKAWKHHTVIREHAPGPTDRYRPAGRRDWQQPRGDGYHRDDRGGSFRGGGFHGRGRGGFSLRGGRSFEDGRHEGEGPGASSSA